MLFARWNLRCSLCCVGTLVAMGIAGCGNSCFVGLSINGNGGVIVKAGNPPPSCSLSQATGKTNVAVLRSPASNCIAGTCPQHIFVTVRSIQLPAQPAADADSSDGIDLAPLLAIKPHQIDLLGDSSSEILVENAIVPAGNYREMRLGFVSSAKGSERISSGNACGDGQWNCVVMADGLVVPLDWPGDKAEMTIPLEGTDRTPLVLLPGARIELRFHLESFRTLSPSTEGWRVQNVLEGRADAEPVPDEVPNTSVPQ